MIAHEIKRIANRMEGVGHALTSLSDLEIPFYADISADLINAVHQTEQYQDNKSLGRTGMLMFRESEPLEAGRQVVQPVFEALFPNTKDIDKLIGMYAVNHYETGDFFNPHQDHYDGTVMIVTALGVRELDVYKKEVEDDVFNETSHTYTLTPGSVLLLDGFQNLGHAARCLFGPSISVVSDIPIAFNQGNIND